MLFSLKKLHTMPSEASISVFRLFQIDGCPKDDGRSNIRTETRAFLSCIPFLFSLRPPSIFGGGFWTGRPYSKGDISHSSMTL
jgi:hypothetical protein